MRRNTEYVTIAEFKDYLESLEEAHNMGLDRISLRIEQDETAPGWYYLGDVVNDGMIRLPHA